MRIATEHFQYAPTNIRKTSTLPPQPTLGEIAMAEQRTSWGATVFVASILCMIARRREKTATYRMTD